MIQRLQTWIYGIGLLLGDLAMLAGTFVLAYAIRKPLPVFTPVQPFQQYLPLFGLLLGLSVVIFFQQGLYRDVRNLSMFEEYAKVLKGLAYAFLLALGLTFFLKLYEQSRVLIALYWALASAGLVVMRYAAYSLAKHLRSRGWNRLGVFIVGSEKKNAAVRRLLAQYTPLGYQVMGDVVLPRERSGASNGWRHKMEQAILKPYQEGRIYGVIITETVKNYHHLLELSAWLEAHGIWHRHISEAFDLTGLKTPGGEGVAEAVAHLDEGQISGGYKVAKRVMDEVLSFAALAFSMPLWLVIVAAIKLDSPGPVFFRQERVGYLGRRFSIYKFRSMRIDAPKYAVTPRGKGDPRVTRVGAWLRKTSLDELPQFINVFKGDMSMVGPRPEMPFIVEKYKAIYRCRFWVKPGLTGLWQVAGRDKPLEENIKYDLYYIKKQSLLLDFIILARTIPAVLFGRGAY